MYLVLTDSVIYPVMIHSLMSKLISRTKKPKLQCNKLILGKDNSKILTGARKGKEQGLSLFFIPLQQKSLCVQLTPKCNIFSFIFEIVCAYDSDSSLEMGNQVKSHSFPVSNPQKLFARGRLLLWLGVSKE